MKRIAWERAYRKETDKIDRETKASTKIKKKLNRRSYEGDSKAIIDQREGEREIETDTKETRATSRIFSLL